MSYRVDCENCENSISAAARFCPGCSHEQERAVAAIARMRDADKQEIRTDGGVDRNERVMPLWLWWLFVGSICGASAVVILTGGGAL